MVICVRQLIVRIKKLPVFLQVVHFYYEVGSIYASLKSIVPKIDQR